MESSVALLHNLKIIQRIWRLVEKYPKEEWVDCSRENLSFDEVFESALLWPCLIVIFFQIEHLLYEQDECNEANMITSVRKLEDLR